MPDVSSSPSVNGGSSMPALAETRSRSRPSGSNSIASLAPLSSRAASTMPSRTSSRPASPRAKPMIAPMVASLRRIVRTSSWITSPTTAVTMIQTAALRHSPIG